MLLLVGSIGPYEKAFAVSVFFHLHIVIRSSAELFTPIWTFMGLHSHANSPCLVNLALGLISGLERKIRTQSTYTNVREQQPGLTLAATLHEGVCGQAEDVGVVEKAVHLHLGLSLLAALAVMAKDSL